MTRAQLIEQIKSKKSVLCVGLDTDIDKLPTDIARTAQGVLDFNEQVIEATQDVAVSYKINTAFYERLGSEGWAVMEKTLELIPDNVFTIADAKRGDIGNTAAQYAKAFLQEMSFDAVTLNPYMGIETLKPYTTIQEKWAIVLGLTSNPGSADIEMQRLQNGKRVYEHTLDSCVSNYSPEQLMMVVGATQSHELRSLRQRYSDYFFLIPGVGAQGGDLQQIMEQVLHPTDAAILINVSRGIIFSAAQSEETWLQAVRRAAISYQKQMAAYL